MVVLSEVLEDVINAVGISCAANHRPTSNAPGTSCCCSLLWWSRVSSTSKSIPRKMGFDLDNDDADDDDDDMLIALDFVNVDCIRAWCRDDVDDIDDDDDDDKQTNDTIFLCRMIRIIVGMYLYGRRL